MFSPLLNTNCCLVLVKMPKRNPRIVSQRKRILLLFLWWQLQMNTTEVWIHPLNEDRIEKGEFYTLYPDLRQYPVKFFQYYCMIVAQFDLLLWKLSPRLRKKSTNLRQPFFPRAYACSNTQLFYFSITTIYCTQMN